MTGRTLLAHMQDAVLWDIQLHELGRYQEEYGRTVWV